jgi:hypothetical protein
MPSPLDYILSRLYPERLNADLAAGQPPETSPRHAAHARRLVGPRMRDALATNWEHLLVTAQGSTGGLSHRAPIRRERVHRADSEIRKLITALRATGPMPARGVAIAARLLTDGRGPIYNPNVSDDLTATVALALEHLDPASPLTDELSAPLLLPPDITVLGRRFRRGLPVSARESCRQQRS